MKTGTNNQTCSLCCCHCRWKRCIVLGESQQKKNTHIGSNQPCCIIDITIDLITVFAALIRDSFVHQENIGGRPIGVYDCQYYRLGFPRPRQCSRLQVRAPLLAEGLHSLQTNRPLYWGFTLIIVWLQYEYFGNNQAIQNIARKRFCGRGLETHWPHKTIPHADTAFVASEPTPFHINHRSCLRFASSRFEIIQ